MEGRAGIGVHREIDVLAHLDVPDIRLRNIRVDLHFCQVVGDDKNDRGVQAGGHRLPDIDVAGNDDPVHWRNNSAVVEVRLGQRQRAFLGLHRSLGLVHGGDGLVEARLRRAVFGPQVFGALHLDLRQLERGAGVGEIALRLHHVRLVIRGVDLGDNLARRHLGIPVRKQFLDVAGHLAADLHVEHRVQCASRGDRLRQLPAGDRRRQELVGRLLVAEKIIISEGSGGRDDAQNDHPPAQPESASF